MRLRRHFLALFLQFVGSAMAGQLAPDTPPGATQQGLNYQFYTNTSSDGTLSNFSVLWPAAQGQINNFSLTPATQQTTMGFQFSGYVTVPANGSYTFYTNSDDGSRLFIGPASQLVVDNNFSQPQTERSGTIDLQAGKHLILVQYGQGQGGLGLSVSYSGAGIAKQTIPDSALSCVPVGALQPLAPDNAAGAVNGLLYNFYTSSGAAGVLPDFTTLTPAKSGIITNFLLDPRTTDTNISFQYTGYVSIPTTGTWTFFTSSDDGSRLFIGPYQIVENNFSQGQTERSGTIQLAAGMHAIKVQYAQGGGGFGLGVSYTPPNGTKAAIPNSALFYLALTATPVIAPATLKVPSASVTVSLSDSTAGAQIYYTTDGSTPTTASTPYSAPFTLNVPVTVSAMAKAPNFDASFVASNSYVSSNPPVNDSFSNAITLSDALPQTVTGSNINATWESGEPNHGGGDGQKSIWYKWTAPAAGSYYFSTAGSAIDTTLGVYTGAAVNALTKISDNDDETDGLSSETATSLVAIAAVAGTTYYIAIDGFGGTEGNTTLTVSPGPLIAVTATTPTASETNSTSGVFTITRSGDLSLVSTIYFNIGGTAIPGAHYLKIQDGFVVFAANQASISVNVTAIDDFIYNPNETVTLTLSTNRLYSIDATKSVATVTIIDNEAVTSGTTKDTNFSVKRGFYSAPFDVAVTSGTSGASIRYTLDGTMPTPTRGTLYTGAIHIASTTTLRVIAFKAGQNPTNVDTETYIFTSDVINQSPTGAPPPGWPSSWGSNVVDYGMDPTIVSASPTIQTDLRTIPSMCVSMALTDLFDPNTGIYANAEQDSYVWERPCALELLDPNNVAANSFGQLCGIRIRGGFSRDPSNPKHAFRFFFRKQYNKGSLNFPLFGPAPAEQSIDKFDLRCDQNYSWSFQGDRANEVFARDDFNRDTELALTGFGTRGTYYHLYINGQYWGLYNTEERPEAAFAANYFGGNKSDYDTIKVDRQTGYTIYATDGNMDAWTRLWKQCKLGLSTNAAYFRIQGKNPDGTPNPAYENLLEIDNLIDYMLVIYYGGNLDSPISQFLSNASPNNFFGVRDRTGSAGFRFFTHDAEHTLLDVNANRIGPFGAGDTIDKSNPQWIFQQCMANAEFRLKVADHARKHLFNGGVLTTAPCLARFQARIALVDRAVIGESARWGNSKQTQPCTRADWVAACNTVINNFFPGRTQVVINQLLGANLYTPLSAPNFSQYGGSISSGFSCGITNPNVTGRIYYTIDGSDPRAVGGSIGPAAIAGSATSSNVVMNGTVTLRARILDGSTWSAMTEATFTAPQDFSTLKITEVMYNPPDFNGVDGQEFEFIEFKNTGGVALNLSGATFSSGVVYTFPSGAIVNPGQIIVLVANPNAFASKYPAAPQAFGTYAGRLNNSGATITLNYATGATILSFTYNDSAPWPVAADGLGFSIVPINPAGTTNFNDYKNWRPSTNAGGSPGVDDPVNSLSPILINEALTHVTAPGHEYIELFNPGASTVDISGWYLTDDRHTPRKFRIPNSTFLAPGAFISFDDTQYDPTPGAGSSFGLDSHGEEVFVFSADAGSGALTGFAHGFKFGAAQNPVAFGRYTISTGTEHFVAQIANTPGAANSGPRVGPVVISELMYQPASGGDAFVELQNITNSAVNLYDPANPANNWILTGIDFTFPANISIPAQGLVLICGIDPAAFRTKYNVPAGVRIFGPWTTAPSTTGAHVELLKPDNPDPVAGGGFFVPYVVVEALDYANAAPWPQEPAGNGPSLVRADPLQYGNDPINWKKSSTNGGSPGTVDGLTPSAPKSLTCTAASQSQINLAWTDVSSNETSYSVQRSPDGVSNWATAATLGANINAYQNAGLSASTPYYFRVYASNAFGDSGFSNVATATTLAPVAPNAPSSLIGIPVSQSKIDVSWNDASSDETGFDLERSPDGVSGWVPLVQLPANTSTYRDQNLQASTRYFYRVASFNPSGSSSYSNVGGATTLQARNVIARVSGPFVRGHPASLFVDLDSAGGEHTVAYSVQYDSAVLATPVPVKGSASGVNVTLTAQSGTGSIGVMLTFSGSATYAAGVKNIAELRFSVLPAAPGTSTPFTFGDTPQARGTSDAVNNLLETTYLNTTATIVPNTPPVAANANLNAIEDTPTSGTLAASDANSDALVFSIVANPSKGSVSITNTATGAYSYTPNPNANGADSFTFKASDGLDDSNTATVSVAIAPVNDAPVASSGSFTTLEDTPYSGTLAATDVEGDALAFSVVTAPQKGSLKFTNASTGAFTYTPRPNANGADAFTFKANDGALDSNIATITITITPVNDAPVANDGNFTTLEDTPYSGTLSATDVEGDALTFFIVTSPAKGSLTITNTATGAFTYSPKANANGADSFTFKVNDGALDSNIATVSIAITPVNDAPVASDGSFSTLEDTPFAGSLAAVDVEGDPLTFYIVTAPKKGAVKFSNAATGAFVYTPNANANGADSFSFQANDGALNSNIATVNIAITPVDDAPFASDSAFTTLEDTPYSGTLVATDVEGDGLTFSIVTAPAKGKLTLTNAGTGAYTYTPKPNANGADSFTFKANDGALDSNIAVVSIAITPVNDAPVASGAAFTTLEDTLLAGMLSATDVDGDALTFSVVSQPAQGVVAITDPASGAFVYAPNPNANGADSFAFKVNDGVIDSNIAIVSITVAAVNDAPAAENLVLATTDSHPVSGVLKGSDVDGGAITFRIVAGGRLGSAAITNSAAGTVVYTPRPNAIGTDVVTFVANDGILDSALATLTITVAPIAPIFTSASSAAGSARQDFAFELTASGTAPVGFQAKGLPAGLALKGSTISGRPAAAGSFRTQLTATNAGGTAVQHMTLQFTNSGTTQNHAPVIVSALSASSLSVQTGTAVTFAVGVMDPDGDQLNFSWDFGDGAAGTDSSPAHVFDNPGAYTVAVTISDGAASVSQSIVILVNEAGVDPAALTVTKAVLNLDLRSGSKRDKITLGGTLPVPSGTSAVNTRVLIKFGGADYSFTLNVNGKGGAGNESFDLGPVKRDVFSKAVASFVFSLKNSSLYESLKPFGVDDADIGPPGKFIQIPVVLMLNDRAYGTSIKLMYTARKGRIGNGKRQ